MKQQSIGAKVSEKNKFKQSSVNKQCNALKAPRSNNVVH